MITESLCWRAGFPLLVSSNYFGGSKCFIVELIPDEESVNQIRKLE